MKIELPDFNPRYNEWYRWFAWYPVIAYDPRDGREHLVWLDYVETRSYFYKSDEFTGVNWNYRLIVPEQEQVENDTTKRVEG